MRQRSPSSHLHKGPGGRNYARAFMLAAGLAIFVVPSPVQAQTRDVTADVSAYCRDLHGRDATPNIDRRDNGLLCTVRRSGGLALRHYKINASRVCLTQHRTNRYRRSGTRVTCVVQRTAARPGDTRVRERVVDLAAHCRSVQGRDAFVTRRRTDNRPMCTVRTNRGLGLRHQLIDLAGLCGSRRYRLQGDRLVCPVTSGGRRNGGRPPAPAVRTVDLGAFCRRAFGRSTIVTRRRTDNAPMCTVRTDRGLGLRHHAIDPRRVCGSRRFRVVGDRIHCGG